MRIQHLAAVSVAALSAALIGTCAYAAPYKAPLAADGHPDLQGNWTTATITPLTRDPKLGDRNVLTKEEAAKIEKATQDQIARADAPTPPEATVRRTLKKACRAAAPDGISGFNCGYNQGWKDPGTTLITINGEKRASIITSPANGQFPPRAGGAPDPRAQRARMAGRTDNPEGFSLGERCLLSFGSSAGPPMLPLMYNNTYQIVQTKDEVAIDVEMVHDIRHIHLNAQHVPASMKLWMGDSVGHWDGDTLVVETTNMRPEQGLRGGASTQKVTERFRRISPDSLSYQFTVKTPRSGRALFRRGADAPDQGTGLRIRACRRGQLPALTGMLAGARAEEAKTAQSGAAKPGGE